MNANQLLEHLRNGAILKARYKYNSFKLINTLTMPTGEHIRIQGSVMKPLLQDGKLRSVSWSGGAQDYYLTEKTTDEVTPFK